MIHDSILFNFQEIINDLREKEAEKNKDVFFKGQLEAITEETELEDLPFYKEYLASFDLEHELKGVELNYPPEFEECKEDFFTLFKLVAGSFSSNYKLEYNAEIDKADLLITVVSGEQSITKNLNDLWSFQIRRLFEIYVEEQFNLEGLRGESEGGRSSIDKERKVKLMVYRKKLRQYENQEDHEDVMASLDDLLESDD
jgi:hypothetical protein